MGRQIKVRDKTMEKIERIKNKYGIPSYTDTIDFLVEKFEEVENIIMKASLIDSVLEVIQLVDKLLDRLGDEQTLQALLFVASVARRWNAQRKAM